MYTRKTYLDKIRPFMGKPIVKVITGLRRCGKSCFLRQMMQDLHERGSVRQGNCLLIDKESLEFEDIATHRDLHLKVTNWAKGKRDRLHVFVDEVQEITDWEKAVASLSKRTDMDITITGSNAHMFSSELATLLSGRYIEFPLQTLSFPEFMLFRGSRDEQIEDEFRKYIRYGGFPAIHLLDLTDETVYQYINAIHDTILLKDVVARHEVRNVPLLQNIDRFLLDNVGNIFSANKISQYLRSQHLKVGVETVQSYVGYLVDAQIAQKAQRFDIEGKRHFEISEKYYLGDIGLRHSLLGFREGDISGILENLVFLDLRRRGFRVSVGQLCQKEVDFVATRENEKIYVQVAYLLADRRTLDREIAPLNAIDDNYPKYLLTMDRDFGKDIDGIHREYLVDFLLRP